MNLLRELRLEKKVLVPTIPLLVTGCLWAASLYQVELVQIIPAFVIAYIPWVLYRSWQQTDRYEFPLFVPIIGMYWLAFVLPLFWGVRQVSSDSGSHPISEAAITGTMFLAMEGVIALCCGAVLSRGITWFPAKRIEIPDHRSHRRYLGIVLIASTFLRVSVPILALGSGGRQILNNIETIVPSVTFGLLFRYWLRGKASQWDKFLVVGYLVSSTVLGIASGWLGSVVAIAIVCSAIYGYERRRLPVIALVAVFPIVLFFQPAKGAFRERYWYSAGTDGTTSERLWFWADESWRMWSQALDDPGSEASQMLANSALERLSLFQQTANVVDLTPGVVPYQYGKLYSYLAVTFVPRFIWPDKPSVNDANAWYQVSYRLTSPRHLQGVSIAVGALTESYVNFGWFGPLVVMIPLGVLLGLFQRFFLRSNTGMVLGTIGAVLIPQLIAIESQLAQYLAGLVQQIAIAILVLLPVLHVYQPARTGSRHLGTFRFVRSKPGMSATANAENRS